MQIQELSHQGVEYLFQSPEVASKAPIILVHGAYNNGFVWRYNFMPYFAQKGHPVYAIHLKNQRKVASPLTLFSYSLKAYVRRLRVLVELVGENPILVGHSMGGLVVQKYLSNYPDTSRLACLLASLPVYGMRNTIWGMIKEPLMLLNYTVLTLFPGIVNYGPAPRGLLSKREISPDNLRQFTDSIQRESAIALSNCLVPNIQINKVQKTKLLIYGASLDNLALESDVEKMAEIYGVKAKIYSDAAHFLMMEPEWQEIADAISLETEANFQKQV